MISTRLTKQLGIRHPVVQAALGGVACADLVAAVSNAGGLGILGMNRRSPDFIRNQIGRTRELTRAPFGVGITPAPAHAALTVLSRATGVPLCPAGTGKRVVPFFRRAGLDRRSSYKYGVKPMLVVQVEYRQRTGEGFRHAALKGLRPDQSHGGWFSRRSHDCSPS